MIPVKEHLRREHLGEIGLMCYLNPKVRIIIMWLLLGPYSKLGVAPSSLWHLHVGASLSPEL